MYPYSYVHPLIFMKYMSICLIQSGDEMTVLILTVFLFRRLAGGMVEADRERACGFVWSVGPRTVFRHFQTQLLGWLEV